MKVRVCYEHGQYYIEYHKFWCWFPYQEDFVGECQTVYFTVEQDAIDCAKQLKAGTLEEKSKVVWESE